MSVARAAWVAAMAGAAVAWLAGGERAIGAPPQSQTEEFTPLKLRGYGTVSAVLTQGGGGKSHLKVTCESEEKARLLHAKYLSDLLVLPGVKQTAPNGAEMNSYEAEGEGWLAAFCQGNTVSIVSADSEPALKQFAQDLGLQGATTAQVEVPMYLNRWDKYGFRFYYRPWMTPRNSSPKNYPFVADFDYAKEKGECGFVFWDGRDPINTAEGLMTYPSWDWALRAAAGRRLPIAINGSVGFSSDGNWMTNRYALQVQQKMPQFCGNFHEVGSGYLGGQGVISWCGKEASDTGLGIVQDSYRRWASQDSVVSFLEPHGELFHGEQDLLLEYGPLADASFREYLRTCYGNIAALSQRWFGTPGKLTAWENIRVPELASVLGWDARAIDLSGTWAVGYEYPPGKTQLTPEDMKVRSYSERITTDPAPREWFGVNFNDKSWPRIVAPGTDRSFFIPHRPAVYRRNVKLDGFQLRSQPAWWLYVCDFNTAFQDKVSAWVNGTNVGESTIAARRSPHWAAFEVTKALKSGDNQISLRLPQGYLGYRVYLSPCEPRHYPNLGEDRNAQWVDFVNWTCATRMTQVKRGMEMIRQVDPNRQITLMAPDHYANDIKQLALNYGGEFHNTGYMGVFYADYLPGMMQGIRFPFSIEPGEPAKDVNEFKKMMGLYLTENVQGVDYYIHEGSITWNKDIRENFESHLPLYHLFGKYHAPKGNVGVLFATRALNLTGFPWGNDPNSNLAAGYFQWNIASILRGHYAYDFLTESSFEGTDAGAYNVIIDSNSSILDETLMSRIEQWIRQGGIFITSGQTGRHTPTKFNQWPISRLSGYQVVRIDPHTQEGMPKETHRLAAVPGCDVFQESEWKGVVANGLGLKKQAQECKDLMRWDDGSVAIGARPLGKGMIIHVGVKFDRARLPDRVEASGGADSFSKLRRLYATLLDKYAVPQTPDSCPTPGVYTRHFISNNGLHDVWVVWNQNPGAVTTTLVMGQGIQPGTALNIASNENLKTSRSDGHNVISDIHLEPNQAAAFLTNRGNIANASKEWFELQRDWWRGTAAPTEQRLPGTPGKFTLDLTDAWDFHPLNQGDNEADLLNGGGSGWRQMRIGIWNIPDFQNTRSGIFRKTFQLPLSWGNGEAALWIQSWVSPTFCDSADVYLDGHVLAANNTTGLGGIVLPELKPGSKHVIALAIRGEGVLNGVKGNAWLSYLPSPRERIDLAGAWTMTADAMAYDRNVNLPGSFDGMFARRLVKIDRKYEGQQILVHVKGSTGLSGLLINGRWIRQDHHPIADQWLINITPWVRFGGDNEIEIGRMNGAGKETVKSVSLDVYPAGSYP